jgi:hypothetical protein
MRATEEWGYRSCVRARAKEVGRTGWPARRDPRLGLSVRVLRLAATFTRARQGESRWCRAKDCDATRTRELRLTTCPSLSDDRCRLNDTQATDAVVCPCHAVGTNPQPLKRRNSACEANSGIAGVRQ